MIWAEDSPSDWEDPVADLARLVELVLLNERFGQECLALESSPVGVSE